MKIVTTAKHWQIFATVFGIGLSEEIFFDFANKSELVHDLIYLAWQLIYIGWMLVLGSVLFRLKSPQFKTAYLVFMASGLILISTVITLTLLTKGMEVLKIFNQYPIIQWGYVIIVATSIAIINCFPVRLLKIIEKGDNIDINDYFGDIFLLIFWPIGIWFIQPRLNKLNLN